MVTFTRSLCCRRNGRTSLADCTQARWLSLMQFSGHIAATPKNPVPFFGGFRYRVAAMLSATTFVRPMPASPPQLKRTARLPLCWHVTPPLKLQKSVNNNHFLPCLSAFNEKILHDKRLLMRKNNHPFHAQSAYPPVNPLFLRF